MHAVSCPQLSNTHFAPPTASESVKYKQCSVPISRGEALAPPQDAPQSLSGVQQPIFHHGQHADAEPKPFSSYPVGGEHYPSWACHCRCCLQLSLHLLHTDGCMYLRCKSNILCITPMLSTTMIQAQLTPCIHVQWKAASLSSENCH